MPKVYLPYFNYRITKMFQEHGWEVVKDIEDADLVQFTGGADINPRIYGEDVHHETYVDRKRDLEDEYSLIRANQEGLPVAGICRGGQFLHAQMGGSLYQHVDNHAIAGTHPMTVDETGEVIQVTSTHHQMMKAHPSALVVAYAQESTRKEGCINGMITVEFGDDIDIEVSYWPEENVLCFQPHPEYLPKESRCQEYYFELLNELFGLKGD